MAEKETDEDDGDDDETNIQQKDESDDEEMEEEEKVQLKQKSKSKKKSRISEGKKAWEDMSAILSADQGFMDETKAESNQIDNLYKGSKKKGAKKHKRNSQKVQVMA